MAKRLILLFCLLLISSVGLAETTQQDTTIDLIAPVGTVTNSNGHPVYEWDHVEMANGYELYLAPTANILQTLYFGTLNAADYCNQGYCSVDLTTVQPSTWLSNGSYTLYMNPDPGNVATWQGPFIFEINEAAPQAPTSGAVNSGNLLKPTLNWTLPGSAANSAFFELYVAPADALTTIAYNGWLTREQSCGNWSGTSCSFTFTQNLVPDTDYVWYMRSWGPAGFSVGGLANSGWMEGTAFSTTDSSVTDDSQTAQLLVLINAERAQQGMGCLLVNQDLVDTAYNHSIDMRDNNYFSHTGLDGSLPWDRAQREGYPSGYVGENIAAGYGTIQSAYNGWYNSPGHYANMFNDDFNEAGFALVSGGGTYGSYATLVLGRRNDVGTVPCN